MSSSRVHVRFLDSRAPSLVLIGPLRVPVAGLLGEQVLTRHRLAGAVCPPGQPRDGGQRDPHPRVADGGGSQRECVERRLLGEQQRLGQEHRVASVAVDHAHGLLQRDIGVGVQGDSTVPHREPPVRELEPVRAVDVQPAVPVVGVPLDRRPRIIGESLRERPEDRSRRGAVALLGRTVGCPDRAELRLVERRGLGRVRYEAHERYFRLTSEPDRVDLVLGHRHAATGRTGIGPRSAPVGAEEMLHTDVLPRRTVMCRTNVRTSCVSGA
jgi:hypothetical protein